jgi:hypothetical protein
MSKSKSPARRGLVDVLCENVHTEGKVTLFLEPAYLMLGVLTPVIHGLGFSLRDINDNTVFCACDRCGVPCMDEVEYDDWTHDTEGGHVCPGCMGLLLEQEGGAGR